MHKTILPALLATSSALLCSSGLAAEELLSHEEINTTVNSHIADVKDCAKQHGAATGRLSSPQTSTRSGGTRLQTSTESRSSSSAEPFSPTASASYCSTPYAAFARMVATLLSNYRRTLEAVRRTRCSPCGTSLPECPPDN